MISRINSQYMIIGDTLLHYRGDVSGAEAQRTNNLRQIHIDAREEGGMIRRIGDGCFMDEYPIGRLTIGEGIERIGKHAFANHVNTHLLELPESLKECDQNAFYGNRIVALKLRRRVSLKRYESFKDASIRLSDGRFLLRGRFDDDEGLKDIGMLYQVLAKQGGGQHALNINKPAHIIYLDRPEFKRTGPLIFPFEGIPELSPEMLIKKLIQEHLPFVYHEESEEMYEARMRILSNPSRSVAALSGIVLFDDNNTVRHKGDGSISMSFEYLQGDPYFLSAIPVRIGDKYCYVVREHYFPMTGRYYDIYDRGVYDENGNLCPRKLKEEVYVKYRFLSYIS